jgi:hypothetical protein
MRNPKDRNPDRNELIMIASPISARHALGISTAWVAHVSFTNIVAFPRIMIAASGLLGLVILTLAGIRLFPAHAHLAGGLGAVFGCAANVVVQYRLYRS